MTESTWPHKPDFAWAWKVEQCRRTDYTHHLPGGSSERWYFFDESDVDLDRLVAGVAGLLILSPFEA